MTDRPTDRPGHKDVSLHIILKITTTMIISFTFRKKKLTILNVKIRQKDLR